MISENDEVSFLCLNQASIFKRGKLMLPITFCDDFGEYIDGRVYMHTPCGDIWYGLYEPRTASISGLEEMMDHYMIKPYHAVLLHYKGGPNFNIEIFNQYAVEINYPLRGMLIKKERITRGSTSCGSDSLLNLTPVEEDKLCATISYSALNTCRQSYDLVISQQHLSTISIPVLSKNGCAKLGISEIMSSIEFGFERCKWKIKLLWRSGNVYFNNEWLIFATAAKLRVGDICVIQTTLDPTKFKLAILERKSIANFNTLGLQQGKSLMKFFKIISNSNIRTRSLDLPRLFNKEYGKKIKNKVELLMPDGMVFSVYFTPSYNVLYGLTELCDTYSIEAENVLIFDYVGQSRFYVTIFDAFSMALTNEVANKIFLKDVEKHAEVADVGSVIEIDSEHSLSLNNEEEEPLLSVNSVLDVDKENEVAVLNMEEDAGVFNLEAAVEDFNMDEEAVVNIEEVNMKVDVVDANADGFLFFTVCLKPSHVDQKGHGVYLPRHLFNIYRNWRKSTIVNLLVGGASWSVEVLRKDRMCRFGKGWNNFTWQNEYESGQKLQFVYQNNRNFVVTLVP